MSPTSSTSSSNPILIIDSHVHVWATPQEDTTFPYDTDPPISLQEQASTFCLMEHHMKSAGVSGALIVQPIHHKYDHSYVTNALQTHPSLFRGMLLHDPTTLDVHTSIARIKELQSQGFGSVRFNPYLWPPNTKMSNEAGCAIYQTCGELQMPVGIMCFKGLDLHMDEIRQLMQHSPTTVLVMDHFGFAGFNDKGEHNFKTLLSLSNHPNVVVKISALFRLFDTFPYERVRQERFLPLLEKFGKDRLMFGTDFPYVLEQVESYKTMVDLVLSWMETDEIRDAVMGGTAKRVFWGTQCKGASEEYDDARAIDTTS